MKVPIRNTRLRAFHTDECYQIGGFFHALLTSQQIDVVEQTKQTICSFKAQWVNFHFKIHFEMNENGKKIT